jgi:hypothetical protein
MATPFWDLPAGYEGKLFADNEWDFVILGGDALPGISVAVAEPGRRSDEKKSNGEHGASLTLYGYLPSKVEITVTIWTSDQLKELDDIVAKIWPPAAKRSADREVALDIVYPAVNQLHIKSVAILAVGTLQPGPVTGSKQMKIKCQEFFPRDKKKATKTLSRTTTNVDAALVGGSSNYTTPDGKQVTVTPANAAQSLPSMMSVDTGPQSTFPSG